MTKSDIADRIAQQCGYTKKDSLEFLESVFSIMKNTLKSGEGLKISGFGKFEVKQKKPRPGWNPQTGKTITIEARQVLTFKLSPILRTSINSEHL